MSDKLVLVARQLEVGSIVVFSLDVKVKACNDDGSVCVPRTPHRREYEGLILAADVGAADLVIDAGIPSEAVDSCDILAWNALKKDNTTRPSISCGFYTLRSRSKISRRTCVVPNLNRVVCRVGPDNGDVLVPLGAQRQSTIGILKQNDPLPSCVGRQIEMLLRADIRDSQLIIRRLAIKESKPQEDNVVIDQSLIKFAFFDQSSERS